jgi:hypothetical protein
MQFFQIIFLLVMLFELIGSGDNDGDYHRIAIAETRYWGFQAGEWTSKEVCASL